jgi:hypothetical protein
MRPDTKSLLRSGPHLCGDPACPQCFGEPPEEINGEALTEVGRLREELAAAKEAAEGAVAAARTLGTQHRATELYLRGQISVAYAALQGADQYCPDLDDHGSQMSDVCEVCMQAGLVRTALAALDAEVPDDDT